MADNISLELLAKTIQTNFDRIFGELTAIKGRLDTIEESLTDHRNELTVVTGIALKASGEKLIWQRLEKRIAALEQARS